MTWIDNLHPASFRGAAFLVQSHQETGGRRVDVRQYPQRDAPSTEDLGRKADVWRMRAWIIQSVATQDYFSARDTLRTACRGMGPGTLVHPYFGTVQANCLTCTCIESIDEGGWAVFDLEFVESGLSPSPVFTQATAAGALSGLQSQLNTLVNAFAIAEEIALRPGILLTIAAGYLGNVAAGFLGVPASIFGQIAGTINNLVDAAQTGAVPTTSSITGLTGDPIAIAVTDAFSATAAAIVAQQVAAASPTAPTTTQTASGAATAAPAAPDAVTGVTTTMLSMPSDPTYGLLPLASWGINLPAPSGLQVPLQLTLQQMMVGLVQGAATIAIANVFANTDWVSSNAAAAAKTQLLGLISSQVTLAAAMDNDALFNGWLGLTGLLTADLVQRAQSLPTLAAYTTLTPMPAAVLANMLVQDGTQWANLAALNDAVHPSFMPTSGVYLPAA